MNRFVFSLIAAAAVATVASAAPTSCSDPTPSTDVSTSGFTYDCGGLTFSDFHVQNAGNQAVGQVNLVSAYFDNAGPNRVVTLNLNPNISLWSNPPQSADVYLWYRVTATNQGANIAGIGGALNGDGSYSETVCDGGIYPGTTCGSGHLIGAFDVPDPNNANSGLTGLHATSLWVFKDIGGYSPIHMTAIQQSITVTPPFSDFPPTSVPEPASIMLIGSGLVATALFGRRALKS